MTSPTNRWPAVLSLLVPMTVVSVCLLGLSSFSFDDASWIKPTPNGLPALSVKGDRLAADWEPTGGPYERVIYALTLGSSNEELYAGTWGNGLYHTNDGGQSWQPTSPPGKQDGLDPTKAQVRALAITPDRQTIYLSRWNSGLFQSTDKGIQWEGISGFANRFLPCYDNWNVDVVLLDRQNPQIIYQATWGGIYTSTNGGDTWGGQDVAPGVAWEEKPVYALIQDRQSVLYAGTFGAGVYRSIDIRQTVDVCNDEPIQTWEAIGPPRPRLARRVYSLATRDGVLWAGTQDGVYRTMDGGLHWQRVITGFADDPRARKVQALMLDRENILYAGTIDFGVYRSEDSGDSWQPYNDGLRGYALAILSLVYDEKNDDLYATTYGAHGVYRNRKDGNGWQPIDGAGSERLPAPSFEIQSLAFAGPRQETLLAGTLVGGLYASSDRGKQWRRLPHALPVGKARTVADMAVLNNGQSVVIAAGTGIFGSTDGGIHGNKLTSNLRQGEHRAISLVQGHRDPALLFTALDLDDTVGIYRSRDGGNTWELRSLLSDVYDLALSDDDQTLFAVILSQGVFQSKDQGIKWEQLGKDSPRRGLQIVDIDRDLWQRWVLGLERQSLHVRALDGIYSSFRSDEYNWQPSLKGQFETIMSDPVRPGVLYATSLTNTIPAQIALDQEMVPEEEQAAPSEITDTQVITTIDTSIERPYAFWVSLDDGMSWQQASFSEQPLTVLTLDPADPNRLFAGTPDGGVYYTTLNLPSPYVRGRAVSGLIGFVIVPSLFIGALWGMYLYFLLVLQIRLYPWQVWALLWRIRAWRLVTTRHDELDAGTRLIASLTVDRDAPITAGNIWDELQGLGIVMSRDRVEIALRDLVLRRLLSYESSTESYRFPFVVLCELVRRNFDQLLLIDQVRNANLITRNTQAFFEQAGFQVTILRKLRLSLWPESPHYRVLGRLNAWLHIHKQLERKDVPTILAGVELERPDLGFVVIDHIPTPDAYRALYDAHLIPLSSSVIRQGLDLREARLSLEQAIREGRGQEDLFDRREPLHDHLALYRRASATQSWQAAIKDYKDVRFWGLPRSGRTSTLWWLRRQLTGRWVMGYVNLRFRDTDWESVLRDLLTDLLFDLHQTRYMLLDLPELGDVLAACGPERDLGRGLTYLSEHKPCIDQTRFVFFIDDANPSPVLDWLQEPAERRDDISLVISWHGLPSSHSEMDGDKWLPPLTCLESRDLLQTIGARLRLAFEEDDLDVLTHAAGGHPFFLRQLGSQMARLAGRPDRIAPGQTLHPGEWPEQLETVHIPAETTIQAYMEQRSDDLARFWRVFSPSEQRNIQLLAGDQPVDPDFAALYAQSGLIAESKDGRRYLHIGLLARWLQEKGS